MPDQNFKLIGPFRQLITMDRLPLKGSLTDDMLEVIREAGVVLKGEHIHAIDSFSRLRRRMQDADVKVEELTRNYVAMPGLIDAHTHICFGGSRASDYALRIAGQSYLEIARAGGGIWDTVSKTRSASQQTLEKDLMQRALRHLQEGITTCEVKSGYGLNVEDEMKMLRTIAKVNATLPIDLLGTCLAAHIKPKDYEGSPSAYLQDMLQHLLPQVLEEGLAKRVDIFMEESAFGPEEALPYLQQAKALGFSLTIHADQFTTGGSKMAIDTHAVSADHLEASTEKEIAALGASNVIAVALPGASLGLGCPFAPARKLLNAGVCLAIASDWNPGSAPMGDLLLQAAVLSASEKLSTAETFAAMTYRAAAVLELQDRGTLSSGKLGDLMAFPTSDYREILYQQGKMKPAHVWKKGEKVAG